MSREVSFEKPSWLSLSPIQKEIYRSAKWESPIKYTVVSTARQIGKTFCAYWTSIFWCLGRDFAKVGYFMPTYKQCAKVFLEIYNSFDKNDLVTFNKSNLTISFANGSTLEFFTAENDNCRGNTFDAIVVDEACFVKDDIYFAAISPTVQVALSKGHGKVLLVSTPKTKNWFYNMFTMELPNKKSIRATAEEGGRISTEELAMNKAMLPEHIFNNEYLAMFIEEGNGLFTYKDCLVESVEAFGTKHQHCVAAVDWGVADDYTVLTVMNHLGELVYINRWRQKDWIDIISPIVQVLKRFNAFCYAETNGIGNMPANTLKSKWSKTKAFHTSNSSKSNIINKLSADFKQGLIKIPREEFLLKELDAYSMSITKTGLISYSAVSGMHDDCVMSLAICNFHRAAGAFIGKTTKIR